MAVLTEAQRQFFDENGYLLVSGLIPPEIVAEAQQTAERILAEQAGKTFFGTREFNTCYTPALCDAAAALGGEPERGAYYPVYSALAIITYPSEGEWTMPYPHIDHSIKEDNHRVFPRPYRLASMLYLSDIEPHGGGTVVWPQSHKQIEALAESDREHYALMYTLGSELDKAGLGEPVELTAQAGDILFYHYLTAHAGSKNTTTRPRLGFNHKW
ncbi:MAG: hypothetical protein OHK0029_18950 [Armatimonadaceae bacterium]